jgi:hypothetical protein
VAERFARAEELSRYDVTIPIELAGFLLDTGDPAGARLAAERALAIEPEAVLPRLLLADALIETRTEDGLERAALLLEEAQGKARRWADWAREPYARLLLGLDRSALERLQQKIAAYSGRGGVTKTATNLARPAG